MRSATWAVVGGVASAAAALLLATAADRRAAADYPTDCANPTATYPDAAGMPTNLNLGSTDVVVFASGTFTGFVNSNLGTICVAAGAAFNPASINGTSRLFVRGSALMPGLAVGDGALLDNEGTVRFLPQPNTNGITTVINRVGATIVVDAPGLALGPGVTVTNDGTIDVQGGVNLNGSSVTSTGTLTVAGALNLVGSLTNTGVASVGGVLTVNSGGTIRNDCRLSAGALINNQTTVNNGVVVLGGELRNNGSAVYTQGSDGFTSGTNFDNTGAVNGSGEYLFTGTTSTQGSVIGASAAAPIVFFDTTPTGSQIFDTQLGTVTNVVRAVVTPPDATACSTAPPTTTTTTSTSTSSSTSTSTSTSTTTTSSTTTTAPTTTSSTTTTTTTTSTTTTTGPTTTSTTTTAPTSTAATSTSSTTSSSIAPVTTSASSVSPTGISTIPTTGPGANRPAFIAGLLLIAVGCFAYAIGRTIPTER